MKMKLFLGLGITLLVMSCTSETEPQNEDKTKITKIYVGAEKAEGVNTRTVTDVNTNSVTWADGDEIAVFHVNGSGRNDYKRFVLESGAGNISAYFRGVGADDYLIPGETYKVVYPYSAVGVYDGVNDALQMQASISGSNNTDHLADYNWLASAQKVIPADGTMPAFLLVQSTALVKIRVDTENFTIKDPITNKRYLNNVNFTVIDGSTEFSDYIYWDDNLNVTTFQFSEVASAGFAGTVAQIKNNSSYYYWVPIIQKIETGVKQLKLSVHWNAGAVTTYSADMTYTPKSVFKSGYIYNVHLKLSFADSGNSGTLTLVQ